MNGVEHVSYELVCQSISPALGDHVREYVLPTRCLDNGDVMRLLKLPYLAGDLHSGGQGHEQILVNHVNTCPQLFNILSGNMSFVGPRPIVEEETAVYGKDIRKLLSVKPGLTGYWQAYARNTASYESGRRQEMEMHYIDKRSAGFDLQIMLKTVGTVII